MIMNGSTMMLTCMAAWTLFALIIVVAVIWQVVLQINILQELRQFRRERAPQESITV